MRKSNGYVTSSGVGAANIWRRYWPLDVLAVVVLALALIFVWILAQRASEARRLAHTLSVQSARQRQAICAILSNIPGQVPVEIRHARQVFASRPGECNPIKGAVPSPSTVHVTIDGKPSVIVVNPTPQQTAAAGHPPPRRSPSPSPTPKPSMTPAPSPSPTCLHLISHAICVK